MQLVVSPYLEPDDVEALRRAADYPAEALRAIAARRLADIEDALIKERLNALAWLAAAKLLEIELALRLSQDSVASRGIFHEKVGIFTDSVGYHVTFSGSSNETAGGLVENRSVDAWSHATEQSLHKTMGPMPREVLWIRA